MSFINEGDPFKPMLCFDDSEESKLALKELKKAKIDFNTWDTRELKPNGIPPYLIRGRLRYQSLVGIREFIRDYPEILRAEEELKKPIPKEIRERLGL